MPGGESEYPPEERINLWRGRLNPRKEQINLRGERINPQRKQIPHQKSPSEKSVITN